MESSHGCAPGSPLLDVPNRQEFMMRTQRALLVAAIGLTMGCGLLETGSSGSGPGPNTSVGGLQIEAPFGVSVRESPDTGIPPVSSLITIKKQDASGAKTDVSKDSVLQLNGVTIPYDTTFGLFDFSKVTIPNATPGSTLTLSATHGADSATFQIKCPDVKLTDPAENTKVTEGQDLTVSWSGQIYYATGLLFTPSLGLYGYKAATGTTDTQSINGKISTPTSGTVKIPTADGKAGYVVQLIVPGESVSGDGGNSLCFVYLRRHLTK
jgi:hypothetical protein